MMKWSEKGSEILSRAGGFPRPLFSSGRRPYIQVGTAQQSHALHWGIPPDPFFFRALPCGGYPQTPSEGQPSDFSINPNPFFRDRPPSRASCMARRACAPSGRAMVFLHPRFRRPLKRGSKRERRQNAAKTSNGKGAQQRRRQAPQKHQTGRVLNSPTTLNAGR